MLFLGMANAYVMRTNMSVAIVAMVNQTALPKEEEFVDECGDRSVQRNTTVIVNDPKEDGEFLWGTELQSYILSAFFYGYVLTQIPFGIMAKKYGAKYFLGVGMLVNSVFGLLVPVSARWGVWPLIFVRFIQGLGEGPIVPCTHAMLAKWIPPSERSRLGAFVYAGAQFGTVFSLPLSGLLSQYGFAGGWPSIFYVFGTIGTAWSIAFLIWVFEDPDSHPRIRDTERKFIVGSLGGEKSEQTPPIPWMSVLKSMPFWAILVAHMGQNYGYETLLTELPTYMKQVLRFSIKENGTLSALPYLAMWIFSIVVSVVADWMTWTRGVSLTRTRKLLNSIGMFGPALALVAASYTGCSAPLTVGLLSLGVGLMGGTMSGYRINHLDISPRFAGILMSLTNCIANVFALLAPIVAGAIIEGKPTQAAWRVVFFISAAVYAVCSGFYLIFASGEVQPWDDPDKDAYKSVETGNNDIAARRRSRRDSQLEQAETTLQTF
ncbi:Putative inorganic phosphate cotransporter [Frankliniella fusca]|uniref:Putative inorganic phosphate cotransporter n=1 Tax=Frankliniella fusca TaxID=407009 RepID=A0AAE1LJ63_9NEOP|nr:Putative inorganic phosphate cotransporter [Frankliniella fusca]